MTPPGWVTKEVDHQSLSFIGNSVLRSSGKSFKIVFFFYADASVSIFLITRTNKPKKPIQPAANIKTGQRQAPTNKKTAEKKQAQDIKRRYATFAFAKTYPAEYCAAFAPCRIRPPIPAKTQYKIIPALPALIEKRQRRCNQAASPIGQTNPQAVKAAI